MTLPSYPLYKDSREAWLGLIPDHWDVLPLKRIASLQSGESIKADQIELSGSFPVFGGNGLRGFTSAFTHTGEYVLIGRQGALCGNINYASGSFWASEHAVVVTPRKPLVIRWLGELLRAMDLNQYSEAAAQPGLSVEAISNLRVPLPPLKEQQAIAAFLEHEIGNKDDLLTEQQALMVLLRERRQVLISRAITGGDEDLGEIRVGVSAWPGRLPPHWTKRRLRQIARLETGHTPSRQHPEYWIPGECVIPWFTLSDVSVLRSGRTTNVSTTAERISEIGVANSAARLLPRGTVFLSRTASVGFSGMMDVPMAVSQDFAAWICGPELSNRFLLYCLRAMQPELRRLMFGATHKTIYMPDIERLEIPFPPLDEQKAIVARLDVELDRLHRLLDEGERSIALLRERRAAMVAAAVTGKIDVRALAGHHAAGEEMAA